MRKSSKRAIGCVALVFAIFVFAYTWQSQQWVSCTNATPYPHAPCPRGVVLRLVDLVANIQTDEGRDATTYKPLPMQGSKGF